MKDSARYVKVVEWSEEDQCFVGSSPGLLYGGCHGDDEKAVFAELCEIVEEVIALSGDHMEAEHQKWRPSGSAEGHGKPGKRRHARE